ncbi:hypothetical protein HKBW3S03_01302 [Candidatus Hakubella thermalkaliphila]|uniref:Mutator family transposase n=1 Tax=Candidatus Hakubella thermalkaliphila TaxID=2754717 RepID=A0A6V8Q472_9ACTN|nr:UPF0236 family protein [Candidatus Hakubella thermalkaliphila]GFP19798.1 hypothetical protein HKBW3S03_01302 [Candidatus Hakubella thermalkaliphila]GFP23033.1 hypothetical protein HKBW3S09_00500 [Candidatus Hakubella thermalkaliphila]GFP30326.1 hypothetical protein HKBW3S34_01247 [Candidatus Hakubella thermalkaliphila]GFP39528.1 hypothetical protein HKBW3S47_01226 [Candidatus Hakubella thermalkaliphila]
MSEITIDLRLVFKIPDSGLTINGLIRGLKEASSEIHGAMVSTLMKALEERVIEQKLEQEPGRYQRNGHQSQPRKLRTSLGVIAYRFAQLRDRQQGGTVVPLVEALSIPAYDHYLEETMEPSIGLSVHLSYRRATSEVERIQGQSMSHTTVHSRLQEFAQSHSPFGERKAITFRYLLVDGTKVHLQGPSGQDLGQAEMRWALASLGPSSPFEPVGFWINTDWAEIRKELEERLDYQKIEILFSDGGPGIEENLLRAGMDHQRCQWHGKRDFPYLLYADGAKKPEQRPLLEKLKSIPAMHFTKAQLEQLRPEDRPFLEEIAQKTQQGFQDLLNALDPEKYPKARTYIQNLINPVTTFLTWWLNKGEVIPLNTNAIESAFSQVCNRIKKVGKRWSEQGLLNWLKVAFYKIFKPELWTPLWHNEKEFPKIKLLSVQASCYWSGGITQI